MKKLLIILLLGISGYFGYSKYEAVIKKKFFSKAEEEKWNKKYPDRPYDQYFETERAFAKDELFAVMSKKVIGSEYYEDHLEKNVFGSPTTKSIPAIYILRCLGRETRKNYLFIVDRKTFDGARIHQKFSKAQMSHHEFFLSEKRMEDTISQRRSKEKPSN